jgi:hypothetical protein
LSERVVRDFPDWRLNSQVDPVPRVLYWIQDSRRVREPTECSFMYTHSHLPWQVELDVGRMDAPPDAADRPSLSPLAVASVRRCGGGSGTRLSAQPYLSVCMLSRGQCR